MENIIQHSEKLSFCKVKVYEDYIYVVMNEGIIVEPKHNSVLVDLAQRFFQNRNFVYITHRIHSYSVDPTIYLETAKIANLIGFIIVEPKLDVTNTEKVENLFFKKSFTIFKTLEKALEQKRLLLDLAKHEC